MRPKLLVGTIVLRMLAGVYGVYRAARFTIAIAQELDRANNLAALAPRAQTTLVMDRRVQPAFAFYAEQRIDVLIDNISKHMLAAIVAVEDRRFYSHHGVDVVRVAGAAIKNVRARKVVQGGC